MTIARSPDRVICDRCKEDVNYKKPHYYGSIDCTIYYVNESYIVEKIFNDNPSRLDLCSKCSEKFIKWLKNDNDIIVNKSIRPEISIEEE